MEVSIQHFSISCVKPYLATQKPWQHVDLQMAGTSESISVCWYGSRYCLAVCQSGGIIVDLMSRKLRPQTTMSHDCHETLRHFDMICCWNLLFFFSRGMMGLLTLWCFHSFVISNLFSSKGNIGYPWEGRSSCSPNNFPKLADTAFIESIYRWYMLVYISGTLPRVPNFSFWFQSTEFSIYAFKRRLGLREWGFMNPHHNHIVSFPHSPTRGQPDKLMIQPFLFGSICLVSRDPCRLAGCSGASCTTIQNIWLSKHLYVYR